MMKRVILVCIFLGVILVLPACNAIASSNRVGFEPTKTLPPETTQDLMTAIEPTQTVTLNATLEPAQAENLIRTLLKESSECIEPCFWNIIPGQTTIGEAERIFTHLGLNLEYANSQNDREYWSAIYHNSDDISLGISLTIQDETVDNLKVDFGPAIPEEWSIFLPKVLIEQYGPPTSVTFYIDYPTEPGEQAGIAWYDMILSFGSSDLIVLYSSAEIKSGEFVHICPSIDSFRDIFLWYGKEPEYPPTALIPLESATSLTIENFLDLMKGNPKDACFDLIASAMP